MVEWLCRLKNQLIKTISSTTYENASLLLSQKRDGRERQVSGITVIGHLYKEIESIRIKFTDRRRHETQRSTRCDGRLQWAPEEVGHHPMARQSRIPMVGPDTRNLGALLKKIVSEPCSHTDLFI